MEYNKLTLSFKDKNSESLFWNYYYHDYIRNIKFFIGFAIFLYAFFGVIDGYIAPDLKKTFWTIRYIVVMPLGLLTIFFIELNKEKKIVQYILAFDMLLASYSILALIYFGGSEKILNAYYPGLLLVILYAYIFLRLRFIYALNTSILIIIGYYLVTFLKIKPDFPIAFNNSMILLSANFVGLMICYMTEFSAKKSFYQIHRIQKEKDSLQKEKEMLENRNMTIKLEIRERRELYRQLFDGISSVIIISDEAGDILDCNKYAFEMLGDNVDRWNIKINDYHKINNNTIYNEYIIDKNGERVFINNKFSKALYKNNNHFMNIINVSNSSYETDFIEIFADIIEKNIDVIVVTDISGNIQYVNSRFEELTGYSKNEALGKNPNVLKSGFQSDYFYKDLWDTILSGKTWSGDFHNMKKNGEYYWEKAKIFPLFDSRGKIKYFAAIKEDITDLKCYLNEIEKSEEKYRRVFHNMQDVYFETRFDGEILNVSPSVERLFNITREDIIGRSVLDFYVSPSDREKLIDIALKNREIYDYQLYMKSLDGDIRVVSMNAMLLWDETDNRTTFKLAGTLRDITERVESENKLKEAYEKVVEYSLNLKSLKAQLIEQEKLASIGQLAAGVAHEINNPAGYIMSNLRSIKEYFTDLMIYIKKIGDIDKNKNLDFINEQLKDLEKIADKIDLKFIIDDLHLAIDESLEGIQKIKEIVLNLKNFARGNKIEEMIYIDISDILENSIKLVWNELKYTVDIEKNFKEVPQIYGNQNQLIQVITNILLNASQAIYPMKKRGLVKISTYTKNSFVVIKIEDNGPGIPQNIIKKVFDPFFTTKDPGQGTGLGLNISYDIVVNKHKGKIEVESKESEFTVFYIYLPINME